MRYFAPTACCIRLSVLKNYSVITISYAFSVVFINIGLIVGLYYLTYDAFDLEGSMVGIEILVKINPEKRVEFLQAFNILKQLDQLGNNRINLDLFELVKEPNTFLWLEHWDNKESLTIYYQDNKYKAMLGAIDIMGQMLAKF